MKKLCLALFLLVACALAAQPTAASRVTFEQRWEAADPQWFEFVVQSDGSAKYRSLPHSADPAPEPSEFGFELSQRSRQLVFGVASQLPRYRGSLDKAKVAFTGTKTLRYEDGSGNPSAISYNYSSSAELTRVTELMQGISETIGSLQTLQSQMRFDKLALEATLRRMEELLSLHRLPERQLLEPSLKRIADDPAILNIARQRARHILQAPPEK